MVNIATPQDDYIKTSLRLPADLRDRVRADAKSAGRTMNAEILERIINAEDRADLKELRRENAEIKTLLREVLAEIELLK